VLHARNLVPRRAVILRDFRFDNDLRIEFVRHNEIRRLVEAGYALRPLGFAKADARAAKHAFDRALKHVHTNGN
jgi:predicted ATPase